VVDLTRRKLLGAGVPLIGLGADEHPWEADAHAPSLRDDHGRTLHPRAVAGLLCGLALMFTTGLLVAI
jgi:ZIP family zinc transporter